MSAIPSLIALLCVLPVDSTSTSLRGTVVDSDEKPIAGARVEIAGAEPCEGLALYCANRYRDCGKEACTDERGQFEIRNLEPALKFSVLVFARGKTPRHTSFVNPAKHEATVKLEAAPPDEPGARIVRAVVVDDNGKPIAGAVIEPTGGQTARTVRRTDGCRSDCE
jgi:protocatechuate 3,4-dioxygenase beta subunit